MESEVREILAAAVKPEKRVRMGDELIDACRRIGLTSEDFAILESVQDMTPSEPFRFD